MMHKSFIFALVSNMSLIYTCFTMLLMRSTPTCLNAEELSTTADPDSVLQYPYRSTDSLPTKPTTEACLRHPFGSTNNIKYPAHPRINGSQETGNQQKSKGDKSKTETVYLPLIERHHTTVQVGPYSWSQRDVLLHVMYVNNSVETVSVYEPLHDGTCKPGSLRNATVRQSAVERKCLLAVNAGLFNTTTGACLGNIISNGRLVQDSEGIRNAHFGITRDGSLFFGYLSEIDVIAEDFLQLVGGVIWVLKDGEVYVDESIAAECEETETTGTLETFASVISARTLVGHDKDGRLMIVHIEGKTYRNGATLKEAAEIMKDLGAINAINLDGGGSSTMVVNNTLISYPSDFCGNSSQFQCERNVTTILCVHEPLCDPPDCSAHGSCDLGVCHCHDNWAGSQCNVLKCPGDCHNQGICTENGCLCNPGRQGNTCEGGCPSGWYGYQCKQQCHCQNGASCDSVDGTCRCLSGFIGELCQNICPYGFYGANCSSPCVCDDGCSCDHITGSCNHTVVEEELIQAGTCIAKKLMKTRQLEDDMTLEYRKALASVIVMSTIAAISISINLVFLWKYCRKKKRKFRTRKYTKAKISENGGTFVFQPSAHSSSITSSDSERIEMTLLGGRKKQYSEQNL